MPGNIEDIILQNDRRGISALRPFLPPDFCRRAAAFIAEVSGPVLIATGFCTYGRPETDGPLGAVALGEALGRLGYKVGYLTDRVGRGLLDTLHPEAELIEVPITDLKTTRCLAEKILAKWQPILLISIERCGLTRDGRYLTMRGVDITAETAYLDVFFWLHDRTVGIGDGGNEIGMGNLYEIIRQTPGLPPIPAATEVTHLVIASVCNWGAYGLVAGLSLLAGQNLLPDPDLEYRRLEDLVRSGAVDGITGRQEPTVDTFPWAVYGDVLTELHRMVESNLTSRCAPPRLSPGWGGSYPP